MSELLKSFIFLLVFLVVIPTGAITARVTPVIRVLCFGMMIYFTSWSFLIHIAPLPSWTGTARGFALSLVDIFTMIVLFSMILDDKYKVTFWPPGTIFYFIYFLFALISGTNAVHLQQWGFEILKMIWMYLFFITAYNFMRNNRDLWPLIYAICITMLILFVYGFYQKYFRGIYQIRSTMPHPNSLSLFLSLFGSIVFGVLLNEKTNMVQTLLLGGGFVASSLLIIFTYSRGGLIFFFWGLGITSILSVLLSKMTPKKVIISVGGIILVSLFVSYALPRIVNRFKNAPPASGQTRVNLNKAAYRIANDFFFGVGANNFSEYSGPSRDYAWEQYANKKLYEDSNPYGGVVETIYLLVAAEFGWLGLVSLLAWFWYYLILAMRLCIYLRYKICVGIVIGCVGGLLANYSHSLIEWSLKQYGNFYQLMLVFALIGVIWTERKVIASLSEPEGIE